MTDVSTRGGVSPEAVHGTSGGRPDLLAEVRRLYDAGRYIDAHRLADPLGDPGTWPGLEAKLLGARLLGQVGGGRRSEATIIRLHRAHPHDHGAALFYGYVLSNNRGPWVTWRFLESRGEPGPDVPERIRSDWIALRAGVLALFRDFAAADIEITRALQMTPDRAWTCVEHAEVLEAEDRYEESLAACRRALELRPWFRPAVQSTAKALTLLDRTDEAITLLEEAAEHIQSYAIHWQLASLWRERRDYAREERAIERARELIVVEDKALVHALNARRSDIAYFSGDRPRSIELARQADHPFFKTIAERLENAGDESGRVILNLPFVRQHHVTCAPATLTAIARYWNRPADHLEVAEKICYDGTPWHSEREWAQNNGYATVEFRATLDVAAALLDRGVPFTLATVAATNAHLQAVVGYDRARGSLFLRDPYVPYLGEMLDQGLPHPTGLRALVFVPAEEAHRLEGIDFPDAVVYDRYHRLNVALIRHDRAAAAAEVESLGRDHPDHALTHLGRAALAYYDADPMTELECTDALLKSWPDDESLLMRRFGLLMQLERRREAVEHLERACRNPKVRDPVFSERLADLLSEDARNNRRVRSMLRPLLVQRSRAASIYWTLAGVLWSDEATRGQARDAYRFAATLDDRDERYAWSYFAAERMVGNAASVLQTLQTRAERFGSKSSGPAITLFHSLQRLGQIDQAFQVLHKAIERRPTDGDLLLLAAVEHASRGEHERASRLLHQARPHARAAACHRVEAIINEERGDLEPALACWKRLADSEPLNLQAAERIAHLLAAVRGPREAIRHLAALCKRFPFHIQLHEMLYQRLRELEDPLADKLLRRLLNLHPGNAWAIREIGFRAIQRADLDKAARCLKRAEAVDPRAPATCYLRAELAERTGDVAAARAAYRDAIALDPDNPHGLSQLLRLCDNPDRARRNVRFIVQQLKRHAGVGPGLLMLQRQAVGLAPPEEILAELTDLHRQREDVWQAWAALIDQNVQMSRLPDALDLARRAVKRFPLVAPLWIALARVHRARLDRTAEAEALREALRINPAYESALHDLAACLVDEARFDEAVSLLDDALRREPRNTSLHARRALILSQAGRRDEAIHAAERAIDLDPENEWMWDRYDQWCEETAQVDRAVALAERLVSQRPRNPRLWINLARRLLNPRHVGRAPEAARKAIELDPHFGEAHDMLATALSILHRHTEALQACSPAVFGGNIPIPLRGRAAWVEAQRGNYPAAIERMRAVLDDAPGYEWGWQRIAEWAQHIPDFGAMRQACEKIAELTPHEPGALAMAGHALETEARETNADASALLERAREYYRRAFTLDASHTWCGRALLRLLLENTRLAEAEEVLERLEPHLEPAMLLSCRLQVRAAARDIEAVSTLLGQLIQTPEDDEKAYDEAVRAMNDCFKGPNLRRLLRQFAEALRDPGASPQAAAALVRWHILRRNVTDMRKLLRRLRKAERCWIAAATAYLFHALATPAEHQVASMFVRRNRRRIRRVEGEEGDRLRGAACALASDTQRHYLAFWLTRNMADAPAAPLDGMWTLLGLVCSLHAVRRYDEARELADRALNAAPDSSYPSWLVWRAVSAVRDGDLGLAREALAQVHPDSLSPFYKFLHCCAAAVVVAAEPAAAADVGQPDLAGDHSAPLRILQRARSAWSWWRRDQLMVRCHALAKRRIGQRRGGLAALTARIQDVFDRPGMDLGLARFCEFINLRT